MRSINQNRSFYVIIYSSFYRKLEVWKREWEIVSVKVGKIWRTSATSRSHEKFQGCTPIPPPDYFLTVIILFLLSFFFFALLLITCQDKFSKGRKSGCYFLPPAPQFFRLILSPMENWGKVSADDTSQLLHDVPAGHNGGRSLRFGGKSSRQIFASKTWEHLFFNM